MSYWYYAIIYNNQECNNIATRDTGTIEKIIFMTAVILLIICAEVIDRKGR